MRTSVSLAIAPAILVGAQFIVPQGTGPYRSSLTISELVDDSRLDPFNSSHVRRLMVSRFDPIPEKNCNLTSVPYFAPVTGAVQNKILSEYEFPTVFEQFALQVCEKEAKNQTTREGKRKFPIALFSPGLNTTRLFYSALAQEIASYGFTTITIDHPYDVDVVEFPDGSVVYGGRVEKPTANSTASIDHALEVRAQDASFVLDTLCVEKDEQVVMFGHSFGGAAAATSMLRDKRIRAGVNFDGFMFGPVLNTSLGSAEHPQSFVLWGSDGTNSTTDSTWGKFWAALKTPDLVDYRKQVMVANTTHGSYWDVNLLIDLAGIRDQLSETAQSLVGHMPGSRVFNVLGRYLSSYFRFALGTSSEDELWKGPSDEFPEVTISQD